MNGNTAGFVLRPERTAGALAILAAILAVVSFIGQICKYKLGIHHSFGIIQHSDLDGESNLATWFSASILLACAGLLWVIGRARRSAARKDGAFWLGLAIIFAMLALDETAMLHEMTIDHLRVRLPANGFLYYPWVILGAIFAAGVFVTYLPFLKRLPRRSRNLFLLSGGLYLTGTIVMEMIGGRYASVHTEQNLGFAALAHIEESFELSGSILFFYTLLDYLRAHASPLVVQFESSTQPQPAPARPVHQADPIGSHPHFPSTSS